MGSSRLAGSPFLSPEKNGRYGIFSGTYLRKTMPTNGQDIWLFDTIAASSIKSSCSPIHITVGRENHSKVSDCR